MSGYTTRVALGTGPYNVPRPTVWVTPPADSSPRADNATLYRLATAVELASEEEGWEVIPDVREEIMTVAIALYDGSEAEKNRALVALAEAVAAVLK